MLFSKVRGFYVSFRSEFMGVLLRILSPPYLVHVKKKKKRNTTRSRADTRDTRTCRFVSTKNKKEKEKKRDRIYDAVATGILRN